MKQYGLWIVLAVAVLIWLTVPILGWGVMASGMVGPEWCHWSGA